MSAINRYLATQDKISETVGVISTCLLGVLVVLLFFEVISRYVFDNPTSWGQELSTMMFGALSVLAGSYTLRHQAHVRSDIVYSLMPKKAKQICDITVYALGLIVLIYLFKISFGFAYSSWIQGETSPKTSWHPVVYPIKAVIPLAVGFLILQNVAELFRSFLKLSNITFVDPRETDVNG